ncbi:LacI family transcriptional regulator [Cupriavidus sp. SK-4]|uniref:Bug family tripartite tricarboxylate transporter substrate binding protein n=1 Tax=Cupriavidus sp. SK-4 TaxID=574750 RepID=UPI00044DF97C|nr:tripartite tricarboxylate transporter substrate-binding protein [Cupriavidus sp. SK-4]EYS91860.1 LacI family transcriptional regulator [Cupriavidus sp. SK-4]
MKKKSILQLVVLFTFAFMLVRATSAQTYPSRPIKIVVGYGAGGPADTIARVYAEKLQAVLHSPVIVENKPGAYEQVAANTVRSAIPDGYTLWLGTAGALTMGPGVRPNIPYDILKDFTHIARIAEVEAILAVKNGLPVNSLAEFISYAKANPNKLFFATAGVGAGNHLLTEYIMNVTGIKLTHVPYKSDADVANELTAGNVDFGIPVAAQAVPFIAAHKFKPIAVTGRQRLKSLPNVPTTGESVEVLKSVGIYSIYGLLAPAGLPAAVTQKLSDAFNKVAQMPEVVQRLDSVSVRATTSTPIEFRTYLETEGAKWRTVGKSLNINFN